MGVFFYCSDKLPAIKLAFFGLFRVFPFHPRHKKFYEWVLKFQPHFSFFRKNLLYFAHLYKE